MNEAGQRILSCLLEVEEQRRLRLADPSTAQAVASLKAFQHDRFQRTYSDLLSSQRYARAARFFLEDLYGPSDFSRRDQQFARIVPALVRLFPAELVATVGLVAELHSLSERLDTAMAQACDGVPACKENYGTAWRRVGHAADRERQIALTVEVGQALDRYTRRPLLRQSLRIMRGPARAAGLIDLHEFLMEGFETFGEMGGAGEFLSTVAGRERKLAAHLFAGGAVDDG